MSDQNETPAQLASSEEQAASSEEQVRYSIATTELRNIVERIERLEEERKGISEDIKEVYAQAKSLGFDTKALRSLIALRKKDQTELQEHEALLETYKSALGM